METNQKNIQKFVDASFEDRKASRAELSVFNELLQDWLPTTDQLHWLRNYIFKVGCEGIQDSRDLAVLEWFQSLNKTLATFQGPAEDLLEETLFFPSDTSFHRFLERLGQAKKSLDICVFTITDNRISEVLLELFQKGVQIRIISDDDKSFDKGSDTIDFLQEGIPVRFDHSENHMHHKFAIMDDKLLFNGSFNWTRSASLYNQENMVLSNSPKLIQSFQTEFEKLWKQFS